MRTVKISEPVWQAIAAEGKFGETEDDVLRRKYGIPAAAKESKRGRRGRGNRRFATRRVSRWVEAGKFFVEVEGVPVDGWALPAPSDRSGIRKVRDAALAFGRQHGLTPGQLDAIKKGLTEEGYYVTGPRRAQTSLTDADLKL